MLLPTWFVAGSSLPDMLTELETAAEVVFADLDPGSRDSSTLVITSLIAIYQTYESQFGRATRWLDRGAALYESLTDPRKVAAMQLSFLARAWMKANQSASIAEEGIAEARNVFNAGLQYSLPDVILFSYAWLALALINRGRSREGIASLCLESLDQYFYITQLWWGLAKLCAAQGNLSQAQQWFDELRAAMRITDNPVGAAALQQAEGVVWAAAGKLEEAIPRLRQAVVAWGSLKRRYQHALTAQRLAEVLLTRARMGSTNRFAAQATREEAQRLLDTALLVYEDLQLPTGIQAVHALRSRTHLEAQRKRRRTLETRQEGHGLTSREWQVLRQVTAGHTNCEIAGALQISVGTVELHVNHILTKLGCETRMQAATYAITQGWLNKLSN